MKHLLKILPLIVIAAILSACNSDGCTDGSRALPHAVMYKVGTNEKTSVSNLAVYGIGAPGDSMIVDTSTVSEFYLPLRPSADETRFVIDYTDLDHVSDTLTMHYEAVPYFVSEDCGVTFFYNITSYEHTQHFLPFRKPPHPELPAEPDALRQGCGPAQSLRRRRHLRP